MQRDGPVHATDAFSFWSELAQTCWLPHAHEVAFPKTRRQSGAVDYTESYRIILGKAGIQGTTCYKLNCVPLKFIQ